MVNDKYLVARGGEKERQCYFLFYFCRSTDFGIMCAKGEEKGCIP